MAAPLRNHATLANLKRGGQDGKKPLRKSITDEARKLSRKLLGDSAYRRMLMKRLRAGTIQPGVEALLYYYAYGKPKEIIETVAPGDVKIIHQYADDDKRPPKVSKEPNNGDSIH